jgi:hypothetical protein
MSQYYPSSNNSKDNGVPPPPPNSEATASAQQSVTVPPAAQGRPQLAIPSSSSYPPTPIQEISFDSASRNTEPEAVRDVKCDILANWLHSKAEEKKWTAGEPGEGVFVKKTKGNYALCPASLAQDGTSLHRGVAALNIRVCSSCNMALIDTTNS